MLSISTSTDEGVYRKHHVSLNNTIHVYVICYIVSFCKTRDDIIYGQVDTIKGGKVQHLGGCFVQGVLFSSDCCYYVICVL